MDQKKKAHKYLLVIITICKQENDPFWEPYDAEVYIGSVQVYLQSLAYLVGTNW